MPCPAATASAKTTCLHYPGVLGLEIANYNRANSDPGLQNRVLGRGWRLSYETELVDRFGKLQVLQADGSRVIFDRDRNSSTGCSPRINPIAPKAGSKMHPGITRCGSADDSHPRRRHLHRTLREFLMTKHKTVIDISVWRCMASAMLCAWLHSPPAHAVWEYSLAAQIAINDGIRFTCGKIEPQLGVLLDDELSKLARLNGTKAVNSARNSSEYFHVYLLGLYEHLKASWGDVEEEAHECESVYISLSNGKAKPDQWWHDRSCADVPLNLSEDRRCGTGPRAGVLLQNTMSDVAISILRLVPSSDVSFPRAGTFPQWTDLSHRIVSTDNAEQVWAIPDSVEFEWKEWPRVFPGEPQNDRELDSVRSYVDEVHGKVQRKRAQLVVRARIPREVIAEALQAEQAVEFRQSAAGNVKLFFIFTRDGLRFRWEQWHGQCIAKYGGDEIELPRNQILSGDWVCGEPEPKPCDC
jgi:hypothetical protein